MHNIMDKLGKVQKNIKANPLREYEVLSIIENGAFDMCFKVRDKSTQIPYIWRGIHIGAGKNALCDDGEEDFMSAMNILQQVQHPHILEHYEYLINYDLKCIFIVMQYMENINLAHLIKRAKSENKRFAENFIWRVLHQICTTLQTVDAKNLKQTNRPKLHVNLATRSVLVDVDNNIKLTDFGLSRLLKKHDLVPNDHGTTISSIGCLIYELCTLQSGPQCQDFAQQIFSNKSKLWNMYSQDLKEIVLFLLQDSKHKNSIDKILKHALAEPHFQNTQQICQVLVSSDELSTDWSSQSDSIIFSEHNSILVQYDSPKGFSVDNICTPDLRAELFYSARRRVFSDGQLYESICQEENIQPRGEKSPAKLTHNVFEQSLVDRLHAIRARERLLEQQEENFKIKEGELLEKERRLYKLQTQLEVLKTKLDEKENELLIENKKYENYKLPPPPPPIPPRKPTYGNDDTYCSIDQDSPTQKPRTIAKLNLAALPAPKPFPILRKVTFQSPKKFISYSIEPAHGLIVSNVDVATSSGVSQKRKSILSIFGLSRSNKDVSSSSSSLSSTSRNSNQLNANFNKPQVQQSTEAKVLAKCEAATLSSLWTKEHKRAAFDMLAAMNSAGPQPKTTTTTTTTAVPNKMRQSIRERSSSLQRHRLQRRSMITINTANAKKRDGLIL